MSLDFSWDGTNVSTKGFTVHNVIKDVLATQNRFSFNPPDRDGIIEVRKKFPARIIRAEGRLTGTSYSNLKATIAPAFSSFLYKDSDVALIFSDETDRYFNAQVDKITVTRAESIFWLMNIDFICSDPFAYDTTATTDSQSITVNDTTYNISNAGHYYVYPTFTITFGEAMTHIYIENNTISGNRLDISNTFANADVLVINCKTGVITLNGTTTYTGVGDGGEGSAEFIALATGTNQLQVGTDDATITATVALSFNKVYLS